MTLTSVRFTLLLLLLCGIGKAAMAQEYVQEVRKDAPVAWWRFQDPSTADGAKARDDAGEHDGIYHGGVQFAPGPEGTGGKAASLNGKTGYIDVPDHPDLALETLSLEFWFKSSQEWSQSGWPASATLVARSTGGDGSSDWTLLGGAGQGADQGCVMARVGAAGRSDTVTASPPGLDDGKWHYIVWTRQASGGNNLYVDGGLAVTANDGGGSILSHRPLQLGGDPWLGGKFLDGLLAEVAIYHKVLDAARVQAHAAAAGLKIRQWPQQAAPSETAGGWVKYEGNPVLGGALGTCFDISVLKEGSLYRMWFSWRPRASIALTESRDGVHWSNPIIVLAPEKQTGWEDDINRPAVVRVGNTYHLWYTGQAKGHSYIGCATSSDGKTWTRRSDKPVLSSEAPWEKGALMSPHVLWDDQQKLFRMWYSGGEQYEPNEIGYATSPDGLYWTRSSDNPIFGPDPHNEWEKDRVAAVQVIKQENWYLMFYIGYRDIDHAQIGAARSKDGITGWQRLPANPIIRPAAGKWDHDACYKPYAIFDGKKWLLWYNGRHGGTEQIGLAFHDGEDLGFPPPGTPAKQDRAASWTPGAMTPPRPALLRKDPLLHAGPSPLPLP